MKLSTGIVALLTSVAAAAPAQADGPGSVSISNIAYGGSGCPQGTAHVTVNPSSLTLEFDQFYVVTGDGVSVAQSRKNCQLNVALVVPSGYRWTLAQDQYSGWVDLDSGVSANMKTTVYFSGSSTQSSGFTANINGPISSPFQVTDNAAGAPYSACGGESAINVNLQVALRGSGRGVAVTKESTTKFRNVFAFGWQSC